MKKIILSLTILLVLHSCGSRLDYDFIKNQIWQHDSGYRISGDFLQFDNDLFIRNDTIFFKSQALGVILEENRSYNELVIKSVKDSEEGIYVNRIEFTR